MNNFTAILIFLVMAHICALMLIGLFYVRSEAVYRIRIGFIGDASLYPDAYNALPSYDTMMYHPKHTLRWTKSQWVAWVKARGVK